GIHSVTAQCVLRVIIITEEMLANSITVRLENMWQERFLSPLLATFLEGVATVLATPKEDVFIFNIQNDTDVGGTVLNVSFSALAPRGGHYFSSEELQEQLYMKRMALTGAAMLEVLPFDDNVCLREPCENYLRCVSVLQFDSSAPFLASDTILFRPIHPVTGLRCRCPPGFTGDYCETEIDLCYSSPCGANGRCRSREGGYTCECHEDFTGESTTTVSPYVPGGVSDGQWHRVQLHYYNKPVLGKSGLPQGPSEQKVAVVTVDDCDTGMALKFGATLGNYSCAAQGTQSGTKK
ncbi:PREDICTED: cadherin EGF LAG seven-pass G-type receptor 1-like, partial [Tinamus guttatus]|uniref:cadherin EGF LAG seven-pass G-type receptor 1-like n=1 Tax=Tinamus guttatus TaxID=94827 RepID=UPI00052F11C1